MLNHVKRLYLMLLVAALYAGFCSPPAWACRYNVLEVGFLDLGIEPYQFFAYVTGQTSPESVSALRDEIEVGLIDTNVQFELIDMDRDTDHPALEHLAVHGIKEFPVAVLVSPDGQSLPLTLAGVDVSLAETLDSVLVSTARAEVLAKTAACYGVVLVIEGPDEAANALARDAAKAAVAQVGAQMEFMPKAIAGSPQVVMLAAESVAREKVLLWSLGAEPADINEPHAAIFYGRGRWIGPLFRGEQITKENLERVLFVIGADCECGLDQRWLQGTMLPARWDEGLQAMAAQTLGFDPESPLVKMEMLSIVRQGMGGAAVPGVPFGYREIAVGGEVAEPAEPVEASADLVEPTAHGVVPEIPEAVVSVTEANSVVPERDATVEVVSPVPVLALGLGGFAVCVVAVGLMIVMKSRKA